MKTVYLEISSWEGMSIGAEHYYGKLYDRAGGDRIRLTKVMTIAEARYFSKKDDWHWEEGDTTERFGSKSEIIHLARKIWLNHFPDADILVLGGSSLAEPQTVLEGPEELKCKINALAAEARRIGYWDDFDRMEGICEEWDILMGRKIIAKHK